MRVVLVTLRALFEKLLQVNGLLENDLELALRDLLLFLGKVLQADLRALIWLEDWLAE